VSCHGSSVQPPLIGEVARPAPPGRPFLALLGWLWVAALITVTAALRLGPTKPGVGIAAAFDIFGQALALGLALIGASQSWRWAARQKSRIARWRWLPAVGAGWLFVWAVLASDLSGLHHWLPGWVRWGWLTLVLALLGTLAVSLAYRVAGRVTRRRLGGGLLGLIASGAIAVIDAVLFPLSYPGIHLLGLLASGWIAGGAVGWVVGERPLVTARTQRLVLTAAAALGAIAVLRPPSNAELLLLLRQPGAALAPYLAELRPPPPVVQRIPGAQRQWFQDRSRLPAIPPSTPPLLRSPLVIMVGIDSFRADLMADPRRQTDLPELFRLRRESTYFSHARSPGSSTAPSLSAVFSGLYYSQLYWTLKQGQWLDYYPDQDPTPRFPQVLSDAGVTTITFDAPGFLLNEYGIVRGFREEQTLQVGKRYASAETVMSAAIARLAQRPAGPTFLFLHLTDAHSPYDRAGKKATPFEGYLAELGLVDRELGRLRKALEEHALLDRTVLIILSDHGEAFGEHGMTWHGTTLYDELLRVPLLIWTPVSRPRTVGDPVSLIDLGPTILDLMSVATPARFMGQSLVPYLRGERPTLTRPIVAEARLKRSLVTPEGVKIIHDTRAQTVEIFDLARDPEEKVNLFGTERAAKEDELFDVLRTFFQVHTLRRPGYRVPYRRW
jgi:hypothetical protein